MRAAKTFVLLVLGIAALSSATTSQTPNGTKPSFEVATVKAFNRAGASALNKSGRRLVASGLQLRPLIMEAYRVRDFQIVGGPNWMNDVPWDIEALAASELNLNWTVAENPYLAGPLALMLQSLIEDRFQLRFHRESKELSVYELAVARGGPKLKLSADQTTTRVSETKLGRGFVEVPGQPFRNFVYFLGRQLDRPLIDKTGLQGLYDITLQWTPEPADRNRTSDLPTLFTAVQEQLGLRLESGRGAVEMFVIDSVQRPSEN
jgi:uncharacterized protein (TIGR03435 family)